MYVFVERRIYMKLLKEKSLSEIREIWEQEWGKKPHNRIGRTMLIKSIEYKWREKETGGFPKHVQQQLKQHITAYKRNPQCFDDGIRGVKIGTRLIKTWRNQRYMVEVVKDGFKYNNQTYTSISEVAYVITGARWNGWRFFGVN